MGINLAQQGKLDQAKAAAGRVIDEAPSFLNETVPPMLHQWLDGDLVSGYYPWPADVDAERIDRSPPSPSSEGAVM